MTPARLAAPEGAAITAKEADSPAPTLFRALVRAVVAGTLTEVALIGALTLAWGALYTTELPATFLAYGAAFGVAVGIAYGVAEAIARGRRRTAGLIVAMGIGLLLSPLAPFAGEYALELVAGGTSFAAAKAAMGKFALTDASAYVAFLTGSAALYGPLLFARARRWSLAAQIEVMAVGGLVWALIVSVTRIELTALPLYFYALVILGRVVVFPVALRLGDFAARLAVRAFGQHALKDARAPWTRRHLTRHGVGLALVTAIALLFASTAFTQRYDSAHVTVATARATLTGSVDDVYYAGIMTQHYWMPGTIRIGDRFFGRDEPRAGFPAALRRYMNHTSFFLFQPRSRHPINRHDEGDALLRRAAEAGHAEAAFRLGRDLASPHHRKRAKDGSSRKNPTAERWLRQAAAAGHLEAQAQVGLAIFTLYRKSKPGSVEAMQYLRQAAESHTPIAVVTYGQKLQRGDGVERDLVEAARQFRAFLDTRHHWEMLNAKARVGLKAVMEERPDLREAGDLARLKPA